MLFPKRKKDYFKKKINCKKKKEKERQFQLKIKEQEKQDKTKPASLPVDHTECLDDVKHIKLVPSFHDNKLTNI